ncbi:MAG: phosphoglucosamine mutase, partial [Acidimicrobiia bacterium]
MSGEEGSLFGTDGIRGRANLELTPEVATRLARAAGEGGSGTVVVGRDTRRSGQMLSAAVQAGFHASGFDTMDLGIIPVGAVSMLTRLTGSVFGVMVSASHNPAEDNGIKLFGRDGSKLPDELEERIERRFRQGPPWLEVEGERIGMQLEMPDALDRYVDRLAGTASYSLHGLELALDCANGGTFVVAPMLFERLGADIEAHATEPNGTNINAGCGATRPQFLAERTGGRLGLAFDGDGDRLIAIDEDGSPANGDVILAVLARQLKERGELHEDTVVTTVMSNLGFRLAMQRLGIKVVETPVGDRHVLEEMRRVRASLGGEQSGHVLFKDRTTGDGLVTALRLLEVVAATGKPLTELRRVMSEVPQVLR